MATDAWTLYVRWHDINQVNNISEFLIQTHFLSLRMNSNNPHPTKEQYTFSFSLE